MKIVSDVGVTCNVNGCEIKAPLGVKWLTVDFFGACRAWNSKPYMYDGKWMHDEEEGILICRVELEAEDIWLNIFDISQNTFVSVYQY